MPDVFVSTVDLASAVSREAKLGRLRKIGSGLYTRNLEEKPEKLVLRNLWPLVESYLPGALIADPRLWKTGSPSMVQSSSSPITSATLSYLE